MPMPMPSPEEMKNLLQEVDVDPQGRWLSPLVNKVATGESSGQPKFAIMRDDTLRSGLNTPGVVVPDKVKFVIAEKLESMGVIEAEVGYAGLPDHVKFVRELKSRGNKIKMGMHTPYHDPSYRELIAKVVDCGGDLVNMTGYWGYIMTQALAPSLWNGNVEERVFDAVSYGKSIGGTMAIGTDYHRLDKVARVVTAAREAGVDRIVVYDVRGWFVPQTLAFLVRYVRALAGPDIEISVHAHDDFGLATINTVEAIRAGAMACDLTVNSTGHRCGNAAFEQVIPVLESLYGIKTGIDMTQLKGLSEMVAEHYHIPIPDNRPVVGKNMFSYGGAHISGILRGKWYFWENVQAETVGHNRFITFGPTAMRRGPTSSIYTKVEVMGFDPTSANMERLYEVIEERFKRENELTEPEVEAVIRTVYAGE